jgi:release factor glutamine methyltransferase
MKIKEVLKLPNGSYILEKIFDREKSWLYLNEDLEVPKEFFEIYEKIKNGYPIEYIFEEVWFYGDRFYVKEGVLIPRDDTEIVVEKAIELIKEINAKKVVDCCTGSGVIAIEIAKHTGAEIIATDVSEVALEVARKNIMLNKMTDKIKLLKCDLIKCENGTIKGEVLVSNPPYVENSWEKPNKYEPDIAFYGGEDGLDIIKKLINTAKEEGYKAAVIEIGYNQKEKLEKFINEKAKKAEFFKDLAGNERGVKILF